MANKNQEIYAVPTNIITGSLGVGKTTLIQTLLAQKPKDERWAVLVNEFGEVGIDGAMLNAPDDYGIYVREVPGGCMCCTSGLPMQIALNLLLNQSKPDRLLIEPTGLGHPTEVLQTLSAPHYRSVLNVQATFTLIDAVKLRSQKWAEHPTFKEQMQIADVIVKTKTDSYTGEDELNLEKYLNELGVQQLPIFDSEQDAIAISDLSRPSQFVIEQPEPQPHEHDFVKHKETKAPQSEEQPKRSIYKVANHGQGFYSFGWICAPEKLFDIDAAGKLFKSLNIERLKAVLQTAEGPYNFNLSAGELTISQSNYRTDSRLEFISDSREQAEQACRLIEEVLSLSTDYELS